MNLNTTAKFTAQSLLATPEGAYRFDKLESNQLFYGMSDYGVKLNSILQSTHHPKAHTCTRIDLTATVDGIDYQEYFVCAGYTRVWSIAQKNWIRADHLVPDEYIGALLIDHLTNNGGISARVTTTMHVVDHVVSIQATTDVIALALKFVPPYLHSILVKI